MQLGLSSAPHPGIIDALKRWCVQGSAGSPEHQHPRDSHRPAAPQAPRSCCWDGSHWIHTFLLLSDNSTPLISPTNSALFLTSILQESLPSLPDFVPSVYYSPAAHLSHILEETRWKREVFLSLAISKKTWNVFLHSSMFSLSPCTPKSSSSSVVYIDKTLLNFSSLLSNLTFGNFTKC